MSSLSAAAPAPLTPAKAFRFRASRLLRSIYPRATDWEVLRFTRFFSFETPHPKKRYGWTDEQILAGVKRDTSLSAYYPDAAAAAGCVAAPSSSPVPTSTPDTAAAADYVAAPSSPSVPAPSSPSVPAPTPDAAAWAKYNADHDAYEAAQESYMKTTWVAYEAAMASWRARMASFKAKARNSALTYEKCPSLPAVPIPPSPPTMSEKEAAAAAALFIDNFYQEYDIQGIDGESQMNEWLFDFTGRGRRTTYYRYERDGRSYLYRPYEDDLGYVGELIDEKTIDPTAKDPAKNWCP